MFTKTPELSEDLAQDVFARIWISREKLAEVENFKSYLFIIARNIFYNSLRSKVYTTSIESYFEQYFGDPSVVPANKAELKELEELIEQGIRNLPPQQQKAFRLSRFKGLKHEQIAAEMGISKFSVKSHIVRAIAALRRHLEDHQDKLQVIIWVLLFL
jgi:RNA polymerase sigma-70 factor (family 1)